MKRLRLLTLLISTPLVLVVVLGGLRGNVSAVQGSFPHLRGLADGLDGDSAYLTPAEVKVIEAGAAPPAGDVGLAITRQYYLRVVGVRDGSPAHKAGIRSGDYIRGIEGQPTREMSAVEGMRRLTGEPGSTVTVTMIRGNTADPHEFTLTRERAPADTVTARMLAEGPGYIRVMSFGGNAPDAIRAAALKLQTGGAASLIIDLRNTAEGPIGAGIEAARWFVPSGTLATRATKGDARETIEAKAGDAVITVPVVLLVSNGTARASEVFAAALSGAKRAELVGEQTQGSAGVQRLVKLPQDRGLWLTWAQYLTAAGKPIHEEGLKPDVVVEEPNFEFAEVPPAGDPMLDKAVAHALAKKAA